MIANQTLISRMNIWHIADRIAFSEKPRKKRSIGKCNPTEVTHKINKRTCKVFFQVVSPKGLQRSCLRALSPLQIVPRNIWRNANITGQWLPPLTCKGLPVLCTPGRQNVTPAAVPSAWSPFHLFFKNPLHRILWKYNNRQNKRH